MSAGLFQVTGGGGPSSVTVLAQYILAPLITLASVYLGGWLTLRGSPAAQERQIAEEKAKRRADKLEGLLPYTSRRIG